MTVSEIQWLVITNLVVLMQQWKELQILFTFFNVSINVTPKNTTENILETVRRIFMLILVLSCWYGDSLVAEYKGWIYTRGSYFVLVNCLWKSRCYKLWIRRDMEFFSRMFKHFVPDCKERKTGCGICKGNGNCSTAVVTLRYNSEIVLPESAILRVLLDMKSKYPLE